MISIPTKLKSVSICAGKKVQKKIGEEKGGRVVVCQGKIMLFHIKLVEIPAILTICKILLQQSQ